MKPARLALTHDLVVNYGLHTKMHMYSPPMATRERNTDTHVH